MESGWVDLTDIITFFQIENISYLHDRSGFALISTRPLCGDTRIEGGAVWSWCRSHKNASVESEMEVHPCLESARAHCQAWIKKNNRIRRARS